MKVITAQNRKTTEVVCVKEVKGIEGRGWGWSAAFLPPNNQQHFTWHVGEPGKKAWLEWKDWTAVSVRECRGRVRTMLDPALFIAASANWRYTTVSAPPGSPRR